MTSIGYGNPDYLEKEHQQSRPMIHNRMTLAQMLAR